MHILFPALSVPRFIAPYLLKKGYRVSPFSPSLFSSDMPEPPNVPLYYQAYGARGKLHELWYL